MPSFRTNRHLQTEVHFRPAKPIVSAQRPPYEIRQCRSVVKPPFCQFLSDSSRVHPSLVPPSQSPRSWSQMKVKSRPSLSGNLYPSSKLIVLVIKNVYISQPLPPPPPFPPTGPKGPLFHTQYPS